MKIKGEAINKLDLFSGFSKTLGTANSLDEIFKKTMAIFESNFTYDSIIIFVIDFTEKMQEKVKTGIRTFRHIPSKSLDNIKSLTEILQGKGVMQIKNWQEEKELQAIFFESDLIKSVLLIPLLSNKQIFGFITIGESSDYTFSDNEIILFETIGHLVSYNVCHFLFQENMQKQNNELKEITKRMRHDFANDLQSLSMALELLATTNLSDDQEKYVRILEKSKNSAIVKLQELKQLKDKYEKDVDFFIGIPLE
ncbi:MAG: hypothetical protein KAR08_04985 [Candidatus Heimdallarchaeota archaeon]|nr:hypothetical protein [Candidatus Heimdallarchaeota archaeon]